MNAGTCWGKNTIDRSGRGIEKPRKPLTLTLTYVSVTFASVFWNEHPKYFYFDFTGVALRDSPVGLAAYILEKFSTWTEKNWRSLPDGGLTRKYRLTDLLDNVMIYWVTGSITTSMRLYSETFSKAQFAMKLDR
jgi:hypothetical protein